MGVELVEAVEAVEMADAFERETEYAREGRSMADERGVARGVPRGVKAGTESSSLEGHSSVERDECAAQKMSPQVLRGEDQREKGMDRKERAARTGSGVSG